MAAVNLVLDQLGPGDRILAPHDCYGGTYRLLSSRRDKGLFDVAFVDQGDEVALSAGLKASLALVLVETPSNPLMRVVDIGDIVERAKQAGSRGSPWIAPSYLRRFSSRFRSTPTSSSIRR
jgi:cystathionine gamma-synthase